MIILIYKDFSEVRSGSATKEVLCEKCGNRFFYEMTKTVTGVGSSPYFLIDGTAKRVAARRAESQLQYALAHDIRIVPCPHCGWYQSEMVRRVLNARYTWMSTLAWIGLVAGTFIMTMLYAEFSNHWKKSHFDEKWWLVGMEVCIILAWRGMILARRRRLRKIDLNCDWKSPAPIVPLP
jgi:DNA-directed RNA polymerase subunit RPC12/RpoP